MLPALWEQFGDDPFLFQHDCTPVTKARSIKTWMSEFGVEELDWPAQSPDLNPIEHLWDELERRLRARPSRPTSVPYLCVSRGTFSFFMTEAILLFSPHSSPLGKLKHQVKSRLHWILQCSCVSCTLVGLGAIFWNKHVHGKPHFSTWHALLGLVTVCVVVLQSVAALPLIYHKLAKGWSLAKLKRYHAAVGLVTYLLGSASLLLGVSSAWFTSSIGGNAWYITALCPALSALTIMNQVTNAYMAKKRLQS
ncbi:hypothetical protein QTP70_007365 [Hemibagrus guttatus]|uniref:ascorbate ferrireductase (transmembrane) n=1 Tax=Hemibagrus guttatus TaxID=175788 RepID=A0AAE0Q267_9TELE|nr:hypothetical protein QTP70_007365 [Hemibagrus guttatus]